MIYSNGHGREPVDSARKKTLKKRGFRYYDINAQEVTPDPKMRELLVTLGKAMTARKNQPAEGGGDIAPVYTYFGQFIDHDISAGTDRDPEVKSAIAGVSMHGSGKLDPLPRTKVERSVSNLSTGKLDLDSLYGDVVTNSDFDRKFAYSLRHPTLPGKMLIANTSPVLDQAGNVVRVPLPKDGADDVLRLGRRLEDTFTEEELRNLPKSLASAFFFSDDQGELGGINRHRALMGDLRNDENLFVSQLHLSMLRMHNKVVDACNDPKTLSEGDLFDWAKTRTKWLYQWLVVNTYLPAICDPSALATVLDNKAAIYSSFLHATGGTDDDQLPLPLEFSAAAFRFGHSMVRPSYDWNRHFPNAGLRLLFSFTGGVRNPMLGLDVERLPSNWPAEWDRLTEPDPTASNRRAMKINTSLALDLDALPQKANQEQRPSERNLAVLNLLKGYKLNLPSGQTIARDLQHMTGEPIPLLSAELLSSGPIGQVIKGTLLETETPLWYYLLKEAEVLNDGKTLGYLGSLIVASTLLGLVIHDTSSYWNQPGSDANGRWQPKDTVEPNDILVESLPDMFRAAGTL